MRIKNIYEKFFAVRYQDIFVCLFIIIMAISSYWNVWDYGFVNYDDNAYVSENPYVKEGLTKKSIIWAFSTIFARNWHPLTWLSHMLDVQLFGMNPASHHMVNVLFHIFNSLLLFFILKRMTGDLWRSSFVAALFALHPLHVESVAWLAERKDVLSTFFWMLTLWGYARYVEQPRVYRYLLVLIFFVLGLMAKPMVVTLPFVLLLLDYWPLGRFQLKPAKAVAGNVKQKPSTGFLIVEKAPLFVLLAASSIVTLHAQQPGGAVGYLVSYPLIIRISNALVSYAWYIGKMIWPQHLAVFYPHPGMPPWWQVTGAGLLIVSIFLLAVRWSGRHPWFLVGWLWYLGTLVPVIGLIQVGFQAMADRYTYIPLIGLFVIISWGIPEIFARWHFKRMAMTIAASAILFILMVTTWIQVGYWKNGITLFEHALDITTDNYVAHNNLGVLLARENRKLDAISHYLEALRIKPNSSEAHNNLGAILTKQGRLDEAIAHYEEALKINPNDAEAHFNLGLTLSKQGRLDEAIAHYEEALKINPNDAEAHFILGKALIQKGNGKAAIDHFRETVRLRPDFTKAHHYLKKALAIEKEIEREIANLRKTLKTVPQSAELYASLGDLYAVKGDSERAINQYQKALSIKPTLPQALNNLAYLYMRKKEYDKALLLYMKLKNSESENADTYYNIACIYAEQKKIKESINWLKQAIKRGYKNWDGIKTDKNLNNIRGTSYYKQLIKNH